MIIILIVVLFIIGYVNHFFRTCPFFSTLFITKVLTFPYVWEISLWGRGGGATVLFMTGCVPGTRNY